jgi:energy-coupling factor transporter transmembrane protein EcfT
VAVFRVFDPWAQNPVAVTELLPALLYLCRLALVFACAEAFFRSTSSEELAAAATGLARRFAPRGEGRGAVDPGLYLSLAVGFIPRCFEAYRRSHEAAIVRGYGGPNGKRPRFRSSLALLESFMAASIRGALATSEALEARCYSPARSYPASRFRARDLALVAVSAALAACSLLL